MEHAVPVAAVGTPQVEDVAFEDVAVGLVPGDLPPDHLARRVGVVEPRAAVAGLHPEGEV